MPQKTEIDYRETLYTVDARGCRKWLYPMIVKGRYYKLRRLAAYALIALYLVLPWVRIGGLPAVFFDIPQRKFTILGATFWATDTLFLALFLGFLGITLFLVTALFGRVWCGWICPETVFLEFVFRPIEGMLEGPRQERIKLDDARWDLGKARKKFSKYLFFIFVSLVLSATALSYFIGAHHTLEVLTHTPSTHPAYFSFLAVCTGLLLFQFGWFREQFCTAVCPYARFQSVLLDRNSLVIAYNERRGEPRTPLRNAADGAGECVACGLCVRVCPTGVDIRNGLQLECIHCANCADACDQVMTKLGRRPALIGYATEAELSGESRRRIRPRTLLYSGILAVYVVLFGRFLAVRELSEFRVLRLPGAAPFTVMADGRISNTFQLHITNKSDKARSYAVELEKAGTASLISPVPSLAIVPGELGLLPVFVTFPKEMLFSGRANVTIRLTDLDGFNRTERITLLGPQ